MHEASSEDFWDLRKESFEEPSGRDFLDAKVSYSDTFHLELEIRTSYSPLQILLTSSLMFQELSHDMYEKLPHCKAVVGVHLKVSVCSRIRGQLFLQDMTSSENLRQWYKALFRKDCMEVMERLKKEPKLLIEGWKENPSWRYDGSPSDGSGLIRSSWKGCTALHVGATRGCVDLIKQVLLLCNLEAVKNDGDVEEQDTATESRGDLARSPGQSDPANSNLGFSLTRMELRELLLCKDGVYGLEALAMGAIHYNPDVINLLVYALGECDDPPYGIATGSALRLCDVVHDEDRAHCLETATAEFIGSLGDDVRSECLKEYSSHRDFNFLPLEEYFFHFLSSCVKKTAIVEGKMNWSSCRMGLWNKVRLMEGSLWRLLLELKDGQGRTPFHVALDSFTAAEFVELFTDADREMLICALTSPDRAGRKPIHRAAASPASDASESNMAVILKHCEKHEVFATCVATWLHPLGDLDMPVDRDAQGPPHRKTFAALSSKYGFSRFTHAFKPLHLAIISGRYSNAKRLIQKSVELKRVRDIWYFRDYRRGSGERIYFQNIEPIVIEWGLIEFACLVKAVNIAFIEDLLKEYRSSKGSLNGDDHKKYKMQKLLNPWRSDLEEKGIQKASLQREEEETVKDPWKAVHLVASLGNYKILRMLIDYHQDPLAEDLEGNNGLHYALGVREFGEFRNIVHFLTFESFREEVGRQKDAQLEDKEVEKIQIQDREGCIILLLKVGCDIFKYNRKKEVPDLEGDLLKNVEFCSWWYKKQEKEFAAIQNKLNIASNAISITAALVATASYLGPLEPPLGYVADPINQIQSGNVWVAIFVFCDTLSFYLAIAAIILALIPSLPTWQQPITEELPKAQVMVTLAVSVLLPSIVCVLIAFASSSMAVVSARLISSSGGRLTIVTTCIGALIVLGAFLLFLVRLLGVLFPGYWWARYIYKRCI